LTGAQAKSVFVRYLRARRHRRRTRLAAVTTTAAQSLPASASPMTAWNPPWWMRLFGVLIGAENDVTERRLRRAERNLRGWSLPRSSPRRAGTANLFTANAGGLVPTNGPERFPPKARKRWRRMVRSPERVQLNKALVGFLTHSGYAHGGNGYEGIAYLNEQFRGTGLKDPSAKDHGIDLTLAAAVRSTRVQVGRRRWAPGCQLPGATIRCSGQPVNHDPREVFISDLFSKRRA
jgi:hypothetical protein